MREGVHRDGPLQEDLVDGGRARRDGAQVVGELREAPVRPALLLPVSGEDGRVRMAGLGWHA